MNSIKVCEYSRSRSFHDDLILQDQASGERSQDHWSSGTVILIECIISEKEENHCPKTYWGYHGNRGSGRKWG